MSKKQLILSAQNHCQWTSHIPVCVCLCVCVQRGPIRLIENFFLLQMHLKIIFIIKYSVDSFNYLRLKHTDTVMCTGRKAANLSTRNSHSHIPSYLLFINMETNLTNVLKMFCHRVATIVCIFTKLKFYLTVTSYWPRIRSHYLLRYSGDPKLFTPAWLRHQISLSDSEQSKSETLLCGLRSDSCPISEIRESCVSYKGLTNVYMCILHLTVW